MPKQKKIIRYKDLPEIEARLSKERPDSGDYLYNYRLAAIKENNNHLDEETLARKLLINFADLPISQHTLLGLKSNKFFKMTEIQRCMSPHSLQNRDIIAASKTGSGKTLAYLIPIIENLYRKRWTPIDGLGAIVLVPTRELVYEVLRMVSEAHEISIGLITGGKNVDYEKQNLPNMNIIVCTPGRLLQHMQETAYFEYQNMSLLVIDEADEILSMGFTNTLNSILKDLPKQRQTMLISATLNKKVLKLAKLALRKPEQILLNEVNMANKVGRDSTLKASDLYETPQNLRQYHMTVRHDEKIDVLFSFLKSHQRSKILVFMNSCKQVRYVYSAFKKLKPGLPVQELHGRQKQPKRMAMYFTFSERKYACLFTTNLGARGLNFPEVDWVVIVDCPDNIEDYVHKVGRTARFTNSGKSLVMLTHSEAAFSQKLRDNKMTLHKLTPNPERQLTIKKSLLAFCSEDNELKYLAQRAIISYIKSLYYKTDKQVFNLKDLKLKKLAKSYGLIQVPQITKIGEDPDMDEQKANTGNKSSNFGVPSPGASGAGKSKNKKLNKLKEKIRKKKELKMTQGGAYNPDLEKVDDEVIKKNLLKNQKRFKQKPRRADQIVDDEQDDSFLVKRKVYRNPDDIKSNPYKVSKNQLKKVKEGGHFGGRNVKYVDNTYTGPGTKFISKFEKERRDRIKESNNVEETETNYVDIYASKLQDTELDDKVQKAKIIKEKRTKKKENKKIIENARKNF